MEEEVLEYWAEEEDTNLRIDKVIVKKNKDFSRSYIQKLVKEQKIFVNGKAVKSSYKVIAGDTISIRIPPLEELDVEPEPISLDIVYEDEDIIIINKGKNMVVHPGAGHFSGTLVNGLLYHCKEHLSGINGILRPGIVHRIDRNTTGLLIVCKNDMAHHFIAQQLKDHTITRHYNAIVYHHFSESSGTIDAPIGRDPKDRKRMAINYKNGKHAVTHYKLLEHLKENFSWIECQLETGRTHQIRVHMASIHHPLLGDDVYGPNKVPYSLIGQTLHARTLGFIHPRTKQYMEFEAPLPEYFQKLLLRFGSTRLRR